jgi:hypothetical protein
MMTIMNAIVTLIVRTSSVLRRVWLGILDILRWKSRPASLTTAKISYFCALLFWQAVVSSFPTVENETQVTELAC